MINDIVLSIPNLSSSEQDTLADEMLVIGDALKRKAVGIQDNLLIAESLTRIREKHSSSSNLYRAFLVWLGERDAAWLDRDARLRFLHAYKGAQAIKACGTDAESSISLSKFESVSALAAAKDLPDKFRHTLASKLQRRKEPVTAKEMKHFNKKGAFPTDNAVANSRRQIKPDNPELTDSDKCHLLNLYISDWISHNPIPV